MLKKPNLHSLLFVLLMSSLLLIMGCSDNTIGPPAAMEAAPDFNMKLFDGGDFQLSAQKGKVVVINFFASWCVSCGKETPVIEIISHKYAPQTVVFLAIAVDDTEKKAKEFMKKMGMTIPAGLDKSGKVKEDYGIYGMPTTFFIDKSGKVSYSHAGIVTEELLKHEIDKLL